MNLRRFILASLWHHRRSHLGVLAGAAVAVAVIVGALAVGDSVRQSLRKNAAMRIGLFDTAMLAGDRFVGEHIMPGRTATILALGSAATPDARARANKVQVLGVNELFWAFALRPAPSNPINADRCAINAALAHQLHANVGDTIVVRIPKPSALSLDAPLTSTREAALALRLTVAAIVPPASLGDFSLQADTTPPHNVFISLPWLQQQMGQAGKANLVLRSRDVTADQANRELTDAFTLADAQASLRTHHDGATMELRSQRVFIDPPIERAAIDPTRPALGVLTYFVNEIRIGDRATPYSMVSAMGPLEPAPVSGGGRGQGEGSALSALANENETGKQSPHPNPLPQGEGTRGAIKTDAAFGHVASLSPLPADMADDEVILNGWCAEDLNAKVGDEVMLKYFVVGTGRELIERSESFRVRAIVPIKGWADDRELMPDLPGMSDAENCRDWDEGLPIDMKRIRDKDEQYWKDHRGTPKAFITLAAGRKLWANRFGALTAIRFPLSDAARAGAGSATTRSAIEREQAKLEMNIARRINPVDLGLTFRDVRAEARAAATQGQDFGQLFLGLSGFLVIAAGVLTAMLFGLAIEQRRGEVGLLLAMGWSRPRIVWVLLIEGLIVALVAAVIGAMAGVGYAWAMLRALASIWSGAVAGAAVTLHVDPATIAIGATAGVLLAVVAMAIALRRLRRWGPWSLVSGTDSNPQAVDERGTSIGGVARGGVARDGNTGGGGACFVGGLIAIAVVVGLAVWLSRGDRSGQELAGLTLAAGALLLAGLLMLVRAGLGRIARGESSRRMTLTSIALSGVTRRIGRAMAVATVIACGAFMVLAVGGNRRDVTANAQSRASGTGGFSYWIDLSMPVHDDPSTLTGRTALGLDASSLREVAFVPVRRRAGDDASCLNLNRAQSPQVLGVRSSELADRNAFGFVGAEFTGPARSPWRLLDSSEGSAGEGRGDSDGVTIINAIADEATARWGLGLSVGDHIEYRDDHGRIVRLRLVALLESSVFQGSLIISQDAFVRHFPQSSGFGLLLADQLSSSATAPGAHLAVAGGAAREQTVGDLSAALRDQGAEVTPCATRLAAFAAVENTYLSIFIALGGLGLLLGTAGLAAVVWRSVQERRMELGVLRAVGFSRGRVAVMVMIEHTAMLAAGVVVAALAALLAIWPALLSGAAPIASGIAALVLIAVGGLAWTAVATMAALRREPIAALRNL